MDAAFRTHLEKVCPVSLSEMCAHRPPPPPPASINSELIFRPPPEGIHLVLVQRALDNAASNRSASSAASTPTCADRSPAQRGGHRALGASNHVTAGLKTPPLSQAAFQSEFWHHSLVPKCFVPCGQAPCFAPEHFFALSLSSNFTPPYCGPPPCSCGFLFGLCPDSRFLEPFLWTTNNTGGGFTGHSGKKHHKCAGSILKSCGTAFGLLEMKRIPPPQHQSFAAQAMCPATIKYAASTSLQRKINAPQKLLSTLDPAPAQRPAAVKLPSFGQTRGKKTRAPNREKWL